MILHRLSSVISEDSPLLLQHLSFSEFLTDFERCGDRFFINPGAQCQDMVKACLQLMNGGLKFNIGGLKTSYVSNDEMDSLAIPPHLSHSCRFWAGYLEDMGHGGHHRQGLLKEIRSFFYNHFLHWLEVLSLIKEVDGARLALMTIQQWLWVSPFLSSFK